VIRRPPWPWSPQSSPKRPAARRLLEMTLGTLRNLPLHAVHHRQANIQQRGHQAHRIHAGRHVLDIKRSCPSAPPQPRTSSQRGLLSLRPTPRRPEHTTALKRLGRTTYTCNSGRRPEPPHARSIKSRALMSPCQDALLPREATHDGTHWSSCAHSNLSNRDGSTSCRGDSPPTHPSSCVQMECSRVLSANLQAR